MTRPEVSLPTSSTTRGCSRIQSRCASGRSWSQALLALASRVVRANNFKQYMGPIFAFIIAMTAIIGGVWIAVTVQPIVGTGLSLSGLAAVIGPFLINEYQKSQRDR